MVSVEIEDSEKEANNLRSLKLRKTEFKQNLIRTFSTGGYIFIVLLYLKDKSSICFAVRFILQSIYSDPFPTQVSSQFTSQTRQRLIKSMFLMAIVTNSLFLLLDLIFGVPSALDYDSSFLHGSMSIQIIGETKPSSRFTYVYYNSVIAVMQLILIYLSAMLNVSEEIEKSSKPIDRSAYSVNHIEGDGFTGITNAAKINPREIFEQVKNYDVETTEETNSGDAYSNFMADRFNITNMAV